MSKQITVPIEWFEGLIRNLEDAKIIITGWSSRTTTVNGNNETVFTDDRFVNIERVFDALAPVIQSAEHIIKGGKDETNKV